ncbi:MULTISPECIES: hypothetical protein [unclassified Pseudomonas]|jgi:hypothetical protein|uniref:hypothetical protein n=1 Tax=Pseudomonas sp. A-R-26 TaxID=2832404 RepID=UPI001CBEE2DB|nr:hypothetical protein [Pseudomonas sp. A-R-26]
MRKIREVLHLKFEVGQIAENQIRCRSSPARYFCVDMNTAKLVGALQSLNAFELGLSLARWWEGGGTSWFLKMKSPAAWSGQQPDLSSDSGKLGKLPG